MKLLPIAHRFSTYGRHQFAKSLSTSSFFGNIGDSHNTNSAESVDDFESRMFGNLPSDNADYVYRKLSEVKSRAGGGRNSEGLDSFGGDDSYSTLTDGLNGKLKEAAKYFEVNEEEIAQDNYTFREDMNVKSGMTYTPEDLNLRKPAVWKPSKRSEFEVTTDEVLKKADFRNVRFLANFLTDAGIIIKRSKTGISAKAQRKVAREIKTARAFGLLPFTTMGTKSFQFGRTMEDLDKDFELDNYDIRADVDDIPDPIRG